MKNSKSKPRGFAENLSKTRMGKNNPMAGKSIMEKSVIFDGDDNIIKVVNYPYEITEFLDIIFGVELHKKNAAQTGNITKALKNKGKINSKGYLFKTLNSCSKQIQDIVHMKYENISNNEE